MASDELLSYASVSMTLRPPRVVIVIDGGVHWSYWARRALHRAGRAWGGAGFAVVPQHDGKVHPVLLRACQAYDPDFVVTYDPTIEDIEHFRPGWFQATDDQGQPVSSEERDRLFELARSQNVLVEADSTAREQIAAVCSTYRTHQRGQMDEDVTPLTEEPGGHFVDVLNMPSSWKGSVLACPENWGGTLGAAVALHAGVAGLPSREMPEPQLSNEVRDQLARWLLGDRGAAAPNELVWHPGTAVGIDTRNAKTAHDRTLTHLDRISSGYNFGRTGLLVLGDTPDDLALVNLWRLTFGEAYWLPSTLGIDEDEVPWGVGASIVHLASDLARHSGQLALTSISRPFDDLEGLPDRIVAANPVTVQDQKRDQLVSILPSSRLPWRQPVTVGFAIRDQWDTIVTVPVSVDETGTKRMAAPLPPPTLLNPEVPVSWDTNWQVDIQWRPGRGVRSRGLDSRELFADQPTFMPTWARSSRDGTTYQAQRYDYVQAGIRAENRLARVALRDLSLATWISVKCAEHDVTTQPSDAGRRAALLAKMLGGREAYVELFGGELLPALRAMLPTSGSTKQAYPDNDGISLSSAEGVLTFDGICARATGLETGNVRERTDVALRTGVLRRGLVLLCATCTQKQFVTVDKLGQQWTCTRCDAPSHLDQSAWKQPLDEPTWFYDLHPVARHLLRDNGEVPALLSAHLRKSRQERGGMFDDVEEVELSSNTKPRTELDLVVYIDGVLSVAECKKSGKQLVGKAGREEVRKKCQAAAWLRADRLIFATKANEWETSSLNTIKNGVDAFDWGLLALPKVICVSRLGAIDAHEQTLSED